MTEDRWLTCEDPRKLLDHVEVYLKGARTKVGRRKLRLFGCACWRRARHDLPPEVHVRALEFAERFADGLVGREEALSVLREILEALRSWDWWRRQTIENLLSPRPQVAAGVGLRVGLVLRSDEDDDRARAALIRDLWGNPFRPLSVASAWLKWNDGVVPCLARSVYEEGAFERLPVLADALEDAGCRHEPLLGHLRGPGPHVRGCWAVDLLLGKS
jgi:hypothetical protein